MKLPRFINRLRYRPWKRDIRFFLQRLTRGWDDGDTFSLDHSLAKVILPRLKRFAEVRGGHPCGMTDQEWENIIQEMIFGFEWYASGKCWEGDTKENAERAYGGIELFAKYYGHLWW